MCVCVLVEAANARQTHKRAHTQRELLARVCESSPLPRDIEKLRCASSLSPSLSSLSSLSTSLPASQPFCFHWREALHYTKSTALGSCYFFSFHFFCYFFFSFLLLVCISHSANIMSAVRWTLVPVSLTVPVPVLVHVRSAGTCDPLANIYQCSCACLCVLVCS